MNFLKKGPEIKLPKLSSLKKPSFKPSVKTPSVKKPDVKVPDFLSEIYYELRERHLLPLVVVLLAAIVAVPIALSESTEPNPAAGIVAQGASASAKTTQVVVSKSAPGLRDYRKRLADLTSKDPFKPRFSGSSGSVTPTTTGGATSGGEEASGATSESEGSGATPAETPSDTPEETTADNPHITFYSFAIDVRVVPVSTHGKPSKAKPEVRKDLPELTMLPSRQTPAIVFMGVTKDSKKALMLVSSNVKGIFGDNVCAVGGESCELLAMEPNVPETFVYGGNEKVYRIELLDLDLVRSDKLDKAPLGKPQQGKGAGRSS